MSRIVLAVTTFLVLTCELLAQGSYNRGVAALGAGDTASAIAAFQAGLNNKREAAQSGYSLAAIAFARGSVDEAEKYITMSIEKDAESADALKLAGQIYLAKDNLQGALDCYRRAANLAPSKAEISLGYGKTLLKADSLDAAIIQFSKAKIVMPKNPAIYEGLGDAYTSMGVLPLAIKNYTDGIKLAPRAVELRMKLARVYLDSRKYKDASETFAAIEKIDSTFAEAYLEQGTLYYRAKLYKAASRALGNYLRLRPGSAEGDSLLLLSLFNSGQSTKLVPAAKKSLQKDSSSAFRWRLYAHALVATKDYRNALAAFNGLQRRTQLEPEDQRGMGKAYFALKLDDEALTAYEASVAADSSNCEPYNDLGFLYMKRRAYGRAAAMFEKRIGCDSTAISAYLNGGTCYLVLAATDTNPRAARARARELLLRARRLNPDNLTIHFRLAQYYASVDSLDDAKAEYDEVLRKASAEPKKYRKEAGEAHGQIAAYYFSTRQYVKAAESFGRAFESGYDNATMHLNWGLAILQEIDPKSSEADNRKLSEDAAKQFRRAIHLDQENAESHFWLGEALIRSRIVGNDESIRSLTAEACTEFRKAIKLNPRHENAKKEMVKYGCK